MTSGDDVDHTSPDLAAEAVIFKALDLVDLPPTLIRCSETEFLDFLGLETRYPDSTETMFPDLTLTIFPSSTDRGGDGSEMDGCCG
jgi:hypothetical protein